MLYVCEIIDFSRLSRSQNIFRNSDVFRSDAQVLCLSDCVIVFFAVPLDYVKMAVIVHTETLFADSPPLLFYQILQLWGRFDGMMFGYEKLKNYI